MLKAKDCVKNTAPYIPGKPIDEVKRELGLSEVYKLASNENPLGPPGSAVEAIKVAAAKGALYPDSSCYDLRMAVSNNLAVKPGEIIFGAGSNEIIKLLSLVYLEPGDEIIVPRPTFSEYKRAATLCGASTKEIPVNDQMVADLPAMAGAISSKTKIIYICNPNNPTGTVINKRHLLQMLHRVGKDIMVVLDEAYYEYVDDDNSPDGLEFFREFPNVIVLRTFSKAYGLAGLRVGYALARGEIVAELNKAAEPFSVTSVSQAAALAAWQDKEYLKKSVNYNRVERDFVATSLRTMGLTVWDSQANFLFVDLGMDSQKAYKELKAKGIIVRGAATFGYRQAIRVSIGLRRENDLFLQALKEILNK